MSERTAQRLATLIVVGMAVQLLVVGYVFWQSYEGRVDLVAAQRTGCERSKLDRRDNAIGWGEAQKARLQDGDFDVAAKYGEIASSLAARSIISCNKTFPDASPFP